MRNKIVSIVLTLIFTFMSICQTTSIVFADEVNEKPNVIPALREWEGDTGKFSFSDTSKICIDPNYEDELRTKAQAFKEDLLLVSELDLAIETTENPGNQDLYLTLDCNDEGIGEEGYLMEINNYIKISGNGPIGVFYGTRTILQILVQEVDKKSVPKGSIRDYPEYKERGFMIDVSRKFFTVDFLEQYVKMMSWFKMNDFHIHWTDDWYDGYWAFRIESETHPNLTATDGSYTKAEVTELIDLANNYGVTITPEFDSPSHARPFTKIRPDLINTRKGDRYLDLNNPDTYTFMYTIFDEYIPLFDAPDFHIGCDEYDGGGEKYRQYYNTMADYVQAKGKNVRVWTGWQHESGTTEPEPEITIDVWEGGFNVNRASQRGNKIINSSGDFLYIVPTTSWQPDSFTLYEEWEPYIFNKAKTNRLDPNDSNLLGAKLHIWLDGHRNRVTEEDCDKLIQAPLKALSEKLWGTKGSESYEDFVYRTVLVGNAPGTNLSAVKPMVYDEDNLAFKKPIFASSVEPTTNYTAEKANDLFDTTRWASGYNDNSWIYVDLEEEYSIGRVILNWETGYGKQYKIQVSNDGVNWEDAYVENDSDGGIDDITLENVSGRYVKMQGIKRSSKWGYSIFDFKVYEGDEIVPPIQKDNIALNKNVVASAIEEGTSFAAQHIVDGDKNTRWASNYEDDAWIYVDLGKVLKIEGLLLNWEAAYGEKYKIQTSADAINWDDVFIQENGDGGIDEISLENAEARYVKMQGIKRATEWGYSLFEFEIYKGKEETILVNLAEGKETTAYNSPIEYWGPEKATDGIVNRSADKPDQSRWSSEIDAPGWIKVDLGQAGLVKEFIIDWELANVESYHIEVSDDNTNWQTVYTSENATNGHPLTSKVVLDEMLETRYVRIWADDLVEGAYPCVSIYEVKVLGEKSDSPPVPTEPVNNLDPVNIARGKNATAYNSPISYWGPDKLTDGIVNRAANKPQQSRWSSEVKAPGWVQIDLEQNQLFKDIIVEWEIQVIEDYHIEISDDGIDWETVYTAPKKAGGHPITDKITLSDEMSARYVKVCVDKLKAGAYPSVSIYEIKVIAPNASNINKALGKSAVASQSDVGGHTPEKAFDGIVDRDKDRDSRWASEPQGDGAWLCVDLGIPMTFSKMVARWETEDIKVDYHIEISDDQESWQTIYTAGERTYQLDEEVSFGEYHEAQFVKIVADKVKGYPSMSLYEFELYEEEGLVTPLQAAKDSLDNLIVDTEKGVIEIPSMPENISVEFGGADYEQVIADDLTIVKPLIDTTVNLEFKLQKNNNEEDEILYETSVLIPGEYDSGNSSNSKPKVIPELQQWFGKEGYFEISNQSRIVLNNNLDGDYMKMANKFAKDYKDITGRSIKIVKDDSPQAGDFYFGMSHNPMGKETYDMDVDEYITINTSHWLGAFWSTRTILQILKREESRIPKGLIRDYPKFKVRGFMFDVGRKYIPLDFLKMWTKMMAWYKMNDFHLHMSDQTFDLVFGGFPLESEVEGLTNPEGKMYSKEAFRDFMLYAREYGVEIVPEFDTPGHSLPYIEARPDLARGNSKKYLDVSNPETLEFIKDLFDEYLQEENPVFIEDSVIHIGTDEYKGANQALKEDFRKYQDELLKYIRDEKGRTPRVWGSQTENSGETPITVDGVQMNMWYVGYANPKEMYKLGYDMININDGDVYIVPGAGYYYDYLSKSHIYNNYKPNKIGPTYFPAGDKQIIGGSYALWNDKTGGDGFDNGTSDVELFDRMYDILPIYSSKVWGDGKDYSLGQIIDLSKETGYAPNTNPTYDVKSNGSKVCAYKFDKGLEDNDESQNDNDIVESSNVSFVDGYEGQGLMLKGGESYVKTPIENMRINSTLDFMVKKLPGDQEEQILFESEIGQIKAVQKVTGQLGFSRDFRDYSFNYTLPENQWVHITMVMEYTKTTLYVNGEKVDVLQGHRQNGKWLKKWASLITPMGRIGSNKQSFNGILDRVTLYNYPMTKAQVNGLTIKDYKNLVINTYVDEPAVFPDTILARLGNNEVIELDVEWEEIVPEQYNSEGSFLVEGVVKHTDANVTATVNVLSENVELRVLEVPSFGAMTVPYGTDFEKLNLPSQIQIKVQKEIIAFEALEKAVTATGSSTSIHINEKEETVSTTKASASINIVKEEAVQTRKSKNAVNFDKEEIIKATGSSISIDIVEEKEEVVEEPKSSVTTDSSISIDIIGEHEEKVVTPQVDKVVGIKEMIKSEILTMDVDVEWQAEHYNGQIAGNYEIQGKLILNDGLKNPNVLEPHIIVTVLEESIEEEEDDEEQSEYETDEEREVYEATRTKSVISYAKDGAIQLSFENMKKNQKVVKGKVELHTVTKGLKLIKKDDEGQKVLPIKFKEQSNTGEYKLVIPTKVLLALKEDEKLLVDTQVGEFTVPGKLFNSQELRNKFLLNFGLVPKELKDNKDLTIEFYARIGEKDIQWDNSSVEITLSVPYQLDHSEDSSIIVEWTDKEGKVHIISNATYDRSTGKVNFAIAHTGTFTIRTVK